MSEKCKVGFWKWLLVKSPVGFLKEAKNQIVSNPCNFVMDAGIATAIIGFVYALVFFDLFPGFTTGVIGLFIFAYGYYKGVVCEDGDE